MRLKYMLFSKSIKRSIETYSFFRKAPPDRRGFIIGDLTMPHDIVYILGDLIFTDELRYSLRSVEENLPHRFVWFVGAMPPGLKPDRALPHKQTGQNKWERIRSSMLEVVKQPELSDRFILFNDDFFVMKRIEGEFVNYADRTLTDRIEEFRAQDPWLNHYARTLVKAREELKCQGLPEVNYDVHLPMLFDKDKVTASIMRCSSPQMRSIYGNVNRLEYIEHPDVKVYSLDAVPVLPDFLSTNDDVFNNGKVGQYIRATFTTPSRFEI